MEKYKIVFKRESFNDEVSFIIVTREQLNKILNSDSDLIFIEDLKRGFSKKRILEFEEIDVKRIRENEESKEPIHRGDDIPRLDEKSLYNVS